MHHIFYHANCADGFAAACIALHALIQQNPNNAITTFTNPVHYGDANQCPLPGGMDLRPFDQVTYLDYTPPQEIIDHLTSLHDGLVQITILDHHASAQSRHEGTADAPVRFRSVFDLHRSGASLAWEHFYPGRNMPMAVQLIEHRDLGHAFQQPDTAPGPSSLDLHAYLFRCIPRTVEAWTPILLAPWDDVEPLCNVGERLRQADHHIIEAAVASCHWLDFNGQRIPAVNGLDAGLISDACQALLKAYPAAPFAASWYICPTTGKAVYSLRSRAKDHPDGHINVSQIAAVCAEGGGGHPCAAGFSTTTPIPFAS